MRGGAAWLKAAGAARPGAGTRVIPCRWVWASCFVCAIEGTIGHPRGGAVGEGSRRNRLLDDRADRVGITAVAAERLHQEGDTRVVFHAQLHHHLVEVRPMI